MNQTGDKMKKGESKRRKKRKKKAEKDRAACDTLVIKTVNISLN